MKESLLRGGLAGLLGGIAGALILWGSWLLPALGLILTRVDLLRGFTVMIVLGTAGGVLFGLVTNKLGFKGGILVTILAGIVLGIAMWVGGVLILVPVLIGLPVQVANPLDHWMPLVAFLFYGLIVSLFYSRWELQQSRIRTLYGVVLLVSAAILAPLLLRGAISTDPRNLQLPEGYQVEVLAKGFTFPTSIGFDESGNIFVAESGYSYGPKTTEGRIMQLGEDGRVTEFVKGFEGPINGLIVEEPFLYVSHRGAITRVNLDTKERRDIISNLPSLGDHQNNDLLVGKDGNLYFGQGTATNAGVVGHDNFVYAWADRYPDFHDVPSRDFTLTGENYPPLDLGTLDPSDVEPTGPFAPFGTQREKGEKVTGGIPASGAIHRLDLETGELTVFADGLRNPYGLALGPDGELFASNLGYDDRGVRAVQGSPDWIIKIKEGAWYGWPDFAGEVPLGDARFQSERGVNRYPVIANPPEVEPPLATLPPHYSPMKLALAPEGFESPGLFVAVFGDGQPLTSDLEEVVPTGVIQVDVTDGSYSWFIKNKGHPRAGRWGNGLKRVIEVKFHQDSLYLLDYGVMEFTDLAPNAIPATGVLWKLSPSSASNQ